MGILFVLIIPFVLLFVAPFLQIILSALRLKRRIILPLLLIDLTAFVLGLLLSICAMFISMWGLSPNIKCLTGCTAFLVLGFLTTIIAVPGISIYTFFLFRAKRHN